MAIGTMNAPNRTLLGGCTPPPLNLYSMDFRFLLRACVLTLLLLPVGGEVWGQEMTAARGEYVTVAAGSGSGPVQKAVCVDDAGEFDRIGNVDIQNTSFTGVPPGSAVSFSAFDARTDTLFLCQGEAFSILYDNASVDATGDPNPSTDPGLAYGIYGCSPTVFGPTRQDIEGDPCVLEGGTGIYADGPAYFVPTGVTSGNYDGSIRNTGSITSAFTNAAGRPTPQLVFLAPTTIDAVDRTSTPGRVFPIFEGVDTTGGAAGTPGCLNVSTQSVAAVFLTELVAEVPASNPTGCTGSFEIYGGVSQFRGTAEYDITITNTVTGATATLERPSDTYLHGETVNYTVPGPGVYQIDITDGISCDAASQVVDHRDCSVIAACGANAGIINGFTNISMESNSLGNPAAGATVPFSAYNLSTDTIFLCRGDAFTLDHNESSAVFTDPDPSSLPGVVYGIFECPPEVSGTDFSDVNSDPCNPRNGLTPLNDGGAIFTPPTGHRSGNYDLLVENNTSPDFPTFYPQADGSPGPIVLYVAPETADSVDLSNPPNVVYESDPACINVRIDQAVAVGFLNPIELTDDVQSTTDCTGSFTISGGVSELRGTRDFTITLTEVATGNVISLDNSDTYTSGSSVNYSVPAAGDYTITVEDDISCGFSTTVTHAACSVVSGADLAFTVETSPISCTTGAVDGQIEVTVTGGTPDYTVSYNRTSPATPPFSGSQNLTVDGGAVTFDNLEGGDYTISVTDAAGGNVSQANIEIIQPNISVAIEVVDGFSCFDDANGTLAAIVLNGTNPISPDSLPNYDFTWSNGATTRTITNVPPGTYSVTATNRNTNCRAMETDNVAAPNRLAIRGTLQDGDPATCNGVSDGSLTIPIEGGTQDAGGNYTISFSDGITVSDNRILRADLFPGAYEVVVTDINGCTDSIDVVIAAEKELVITADSTAISCFGDGDGRVAVTASTIGAAPDLPFRATLLNPDGTVAGAQQTLAGDGSTPVTFGNLGPGEYTIVLEDSDPEGCEVRQTVTIIEPELLEIVSAGTTDVGCPDDAGTSTPEVTGGTGPYTYRFRNDSLPNPADSTLTFDSLVVDTNTIGDLQADTNYVLIVTDANGCVDSTTFRILSPPQASIQPIATSFVSCPDDADGQLTVVATPPPGDSITITGYTWFRLNPDNTLGEQVDIGRTTSADLTVGAYVVEVALSNECTSFGFGLVESPGLVQLDSAIVLDPSCRGEATGSIFLFPSGGTPNEDGSYNYEFSTDPGTIVRSNNINALTAGSYDVTITDANGCQPAFDTTFVVEDPVGIELDAFTVDEVSCPSDTISDGTATIGVVLSDGSPGTFDFFWSTGDTIRNATTATVSDLARGPVSVTVTDGFCPRIFTDTVGSPENFELTPVSEAVSCFGDTDGSATVTVTGGTPGYTFEWVGQTETTATLSDVAAGSYDFVVTDSRDCPADTLAVTITQPDALVLATDNALTTPLVTCADDEDGVLAVRVVSGNNNPLGDNPFTWSANVVDDDDAIARNLAADTYSVTVTDTRGCQDSLEYTIFNPQPIVFAVEDIVPPLCFGETAEVRLDTAFGGQASSFGGYTFSLNEDGFLIPADQPGTAFAGDLIVTVFDSVGCSASDTLVVTEPEEIVIDLPERVVIELGDSLQQLNPTVTPTSGTYTYRWAPPIYLSSDSVRAPFINPLGDVLYTLTVTNENDCQSLTDVQVILDANRNVFLPNTFSPNVDGVNDEFRLFGCRGVIAIDRAAIYNRWGGLVSEREDLPADCLGGTSLWDGTANDERQLVDPGVYVYVVEVTFLDGVKLIYRGDITMVR